MTTNVFLDQWFVIDFFTHEENNKINQKSIGVGYWVGLVCRPASKQFIEADKTWQTKGNIVVQLFLHF